MIATILSTLFVQLAMITYSYLMANFQIPIIKGMRDYWPVNNPFTGPFHSFGWSVSFIVAGALIAAQGFYIGYSIHLLTLVLSGALCMMWHWERFDSIIGAKVYNNRFYIGTSSRLDKWLIKKHGEHAGEEKDKICVLSIIILNIFSILLNLLIK